MIYLIYNYCEGEIAMDTIGKRISNLRKNKNLTQQELADLINVSDKTISKWENDLGLPSVDILPKLIKVLETSLDYIISGNTEYKDNKEKNESNNHLLDINYSNRVIIFTALSFIFGLMSVISLIFWGYDKNSTIGKILIFISFSALILMGVLFYNFYTTLRKVYKIQIKEMKVKTIIFLTMYLLSLIISTYMLFQKVMLSILLTNFFTIIMLLLEVLYIVGYIILLVKLKKVE